MCIYIYVCVCVCISYLLTSAKFNIYDVIDIYDSIALMDECEI